MNELQIFENAEFGSVRTTTINGEVMFVGRDVAIILGYSNPNDALKKRVDDEDKGGSNLRYPWWKTGTDNYQRIWSLQLDSF